jgi:hypothetical protein
VPTMFSMPEIVLLRLSAGHWLCSLSAYAMMAAVAAVGKVAQSLPLPPSGCRCRRLRRASRPHSPPAACRRLLRQRESHCLRSSLERIVPRPHQPVSSAPPAVIDPSPDERIVARPPLGADQRPSAPSRVSSLAPSGCRACASFPEIIARTPAVLFAQSALGHVVAKAFERLIIGTAVRRLFRSSPAWCRGKPLASN